MCPAAETSRILSVLADGHQTTVITPRYGRADLNTGGFDVRSVRLPGRSFVREEHTVGASIEAQFASLGQILADRGLPCPWGDHHS